MKEPLPVQEWIEMRAKVGVKMVPLSYSALFHACPRCNAQPLYYCRTPKGRVLGGADLHGERFRKLADSFDAIRAIRRK